MTFAVVEHGGTWEFLSKIFDVKVVTFGALINQFARLLSDHVYQVEVVNPGEKYQMQNMIEKGSLFTSYKYAHFANKSNISTVISPEWEYSGCKTVLQWETKALRLKSRGFRFTQRAFYWLQSALSRRHLRTDYFTEKFSLEWTLLGKLCGGLQFGYRNWGIGRWISKKNRLC